MDTRRLIIHQNNLTDLSQENNLTGAPSSLLSRCHCTGSLSGKMRLIWVSLNLNPRSGYRKAPFHQYKVCFTGCNPLPYQKKLQVNSRTSLPLLLRASFNVPPNLNNSPVVLQSFIVTYVLWISIHFTSTGDDPHHLSFQTRTRTLNCGANTHRLTTRLSGNLPHFSFRSGRAVTLSVSPH